MTTSMNAQARTTPTPISTPTIVCSIAPSDKRIA